MFEITKGPFAKKMISFKGNFFKNDDSGQWVVGSKSKLADVIQKITGGNTINAGHVGTRVFIEVLNSIGKPESKNPGKKYPNIEGIMPMPKDYADMLNAVAAKAPVVAPQASTVAQAPTAALQAAPAAAQQPQSNPELLNGLTDLSDFDKL